MNATFRKGKFIEDYTEWTRMVTRFEAKAERKVAEGRAKAKNAELAARRKQLAGLKGPKGGSRLFGSLVLLARKLGWGVKRQGSAKKFKLIHDRT